MKNKNLLLFVLPLGLSIFCGLSTSNIVEANAEDVAYYLCLSRENYQKRNSNRFLLEDDGYYHLNEIRLNSEIEFYVGGSDGSKYCTRNGDNFKVEDSSSLNYDFLFSLDEIFSNSIDDYEITNAHLTYKIHQKESYSLFIDDIETNLTYNPYKSSYDEYYISPKEYEASTNVAYKIEDEIIENHIIEFKGFYRILFTPGQEIEGNLYLYNSDGIYGSGEDYKYHIYIEDAPQYYISFKEDLLCKGEPISYKDKTLYYLTRDESKITTETYNSSLVFSSENDYKIYYSLYVKEIDTYRLIDDDLFADYIRIGDRGWVALNVSFVNEEYVVNYEEETFDFSGFFLAGDFNDYLFDDDGEIVLNEYYQFKEIDIDDEDYDSDYTQYKITLDVTKDGAEFYISNGKEKYKDATRNIVINVEGKYDILFSEDKIYSRGRHYRYSLLDEDKDIDEILISSTSEYNEFMQKTNSDASYSENKIIYLTKDLDFKNTHIVTSKLFKGVFDGGYHTIKGVSLDGDNYSNLFEVATIDAQIRRLDIELYISGEGSYVGFVGKNYGSLSHITLSGEISGTDNVGLVGQNARSIYERGDSPVSDEVINPGIIDKCENNALIKGANRVGGISGNNLGTISNSKNYGKIIAYSKNSNQTVLNIGGITGYNVGKLDNVTNYGEINYINRAIYVGGISGLAVGEIYFSYNYSSISATRYVGGIIGYYGEVSENGEDLREFFSNTPFEDFINEYYSTDEDVDNQYESSTSALYYLYNDGYIEGGSYVGGIIGNVISSSANILDSINVGHIKSKTGSYAGGISGNSSTSSITNCFSSNLIEGKDYVGGISGNAGLLEGNFVSSTVYGNDYIGGLTGYLSIGANSNIANAMLISNISDSHLGNIAGDTSLYEESNSSFVNVKYNYMSGSNKGINNVEYGASYDDAAKYLSQDELCHEGTLSPYLKLGFKTEYWLGGIDSDSYPLPRHLEEVDECKIYDDETKFAENFINFKNFSYTKLLHDIKKSYVISFMEFREENGDLYNDDETLNYESYELNSYLRIFKGDEITLPPFKYAEKQDDGSYIYYGDKGTYYVVFESIDTIDENITIYAKYIELRNTLYDKDSGVFAYGKFKAGTTFSFKDIGLGYKVTFTYDGKEINIEDVEIAIDKNVFGDVIPNYLKNGKSEKINYIVDGNYIRFKASSNMIIVFESANNFAIPSWGYALIGVGSTLIAGLIAFLIVFIIKKHKAKKTISADNKS